jgi:hypothetical protein
MEWVGYVRSTGRFSQKMCLKGMRYKGVTWIPLAQDRDLWQAVMSIIMNLLIL